MLLCNKHLPAILAHVDRIIRIREHEAEYQRDRQHQGMEIPSLTVQEKQQLKEQAAREEKQKKNDWFR